MIIGCLNCKAIVASAWSLVFALDGIWADSSIWGSSQ